MCAMSSFLKTKSFMRDIVNDDGDSIFVLIKSGENKFHSKCPPLPYSIIVTDTNKIYSGTLTETDLEKFSSDLKIEEDQYYFHINNALFTDDQVNYAFKMEKISEEDLRLKVSLKTKVDLESVVSVKIHLCTITMHLNDVELFKDIFKNIINNFQTYEQRITDLENECKKLRQLQDETKQALVSCTSFKEAWEKDIYSKFVNVLNEKKALIKANRENMMDYSNNKIPATTAKSEEDDDIATSRQSSGDSAINQEDTSDVSFGEDEQYVIQVAQTKIRRRGLTRKIAPSDDNEENMSVSESEATTSRQKSESSFRKPAPKRKTRRTVINTSSDEDLDAESLLKFL